MSMVLTVMTCRACKCSPRRHGHSQVFGLCHCCSCDTSLTREEAQLWALLADLNEDVDPGAHACRLRLSLATRCCPELPCPWDDAEQLLQYVHLMT